MPISKIPIEKLTYEQAFAELESVVDALEENQVALEDAMALFERGQALSQYCAAQLDKAELRVRQITNLQPDDDAG